MKILVLTFYYPPDLSAGSFRIVSIVNALRTSQPDAEIDIVTTGPNRYGSFAAEAPRNESVPGVRISRIPVGKHKSGMIDQSRAFLAFAFCALREVRGRKYDIVVATSSRLMTGFLGALISGRTGARYYLDIRDIFADTIREIAPRPIALVSGPIFSLIERWTVARAETVALVSPGFQGYFRKRYPRKRLVFFTNGVDEEFLASPSTQQIDPTATRTTLTILYAGNIGEGQGLELFLPQFARQLESRARFRIIGDGGRRASLQKALAEERVENVEVVSPLRRDDLVKAYREADVLFLHLNDYPALQKVLPSKIFEYAATGKPILAGVSGFAAEFLRAEVNNAEVFRPLDVEDALRALDRLKHGQTDRSAFSAKYRRDRLSQLMADDIAGAVTRAEK